MHYQIAAPPTAAADKQADELGRLLKFGKQITVQFVTVAGRYKPARARLTLVTVPDRVADQALRMMQVLSGCDDAVKSSAAVRPRPEWTQLALLAPTSQLADPPDGTILEGWDSACLSVRYQPGRAVAWLACCPEDAERLAQLRLPGWRVTLRPNPLARMFSGSAWRGVPSLAPVPGSIVPAAAFARAPKPQPIEDAPGWPSADELAGALTSDESGVLLGVAPDGSAVRLARRAMTLALCVPAEVQQSAVLALMRRGMQAGLGMVIAVDRALLPSEALVAWEARVRLLDVQDVASSAAIPWRQIAPELLAQAIAGSEATFPTPPTRFAAALDQLGAKALRVPAVLGLIAAPGDELRGVLAAGGMIVVPQDGDAASTVIARLLMAYLATPPVIGRATLILADPALVAPAALRDQVLQVIIGERADALLRMTATDAGWRLSGPDGTQLTELLPDLMTQPSAGTGALVETIVQAIGPAPAALIGAPEQLLDEAAAWWDGGERSDDLDAPDEEPIAAEAAPAPAEEAVATLEPPTLTAQQDAALVTDEPAGISALAEADIDQPSALDRALGDLLNTLMADEDLDAAQIQQAIIAEDCATADALVAEWAAIAVADARPWLWRVVLAEDDADRAAAARHALRADPHSIHAPQVYAVLAALSLDAADMQPLDEAPQQIDTATAFGDRPVLLDDALGDGHELPAADVSGWAVLEQPAQEDFVNAPPDADHAALEPVRRLAEVVAAPQLVDSAPVADMPQSSMAPAAAATPSMADAAIRAAWQGGASVLDLIARMVAAGECPAAARARVRQAINACPAESAQRLTGMSGILAASMPPIAAAPELDDAAIWQRWQAQEKTEDMIYALCGRRGGPKADAARDRLYTVIVPRIVAELGADELVDRLAAGVDVTADPRYTVLMQRLARSETPPAGSLEQSLRRRLIAVRQEV